MKEKNKEFTIKIKEKVVFEFAYEENARNVAFALSSTGYYIKVGKNGGSYVVRIYTDRI